MDVVCPLVWFLVLSFPGAEGGGWWVWSSGLILTSVADNARKRKRSSSTGRLQRRTNWIRDNKAGPRDISQTANLRDQAGGARAPFFHIPGGGGRGCGSGLWVGVVGRGCGSFRGWRVGGVRVGRDSRFWCGLVRGLGVRHELRARPSWGLGVFLLSPSSRGPARGKMVHSQTCPSPSLSVMY